MIDNRPARQNKETETEIASSMPLDQQPSSGITTNYNLQQLNFFNEGVSAEDICELDKLYPGFGREFLGNLISETPHRQKLERRAQWMNFSGHVVGQVITGVVIIALTGFGIYAIWKGVQASVIEAMLGTMAIIVGIIMFGRAVKTQTAAPESPPGKAVEPKSKSPNKKG